MSSQDSVPVQYRAWVLHLLTVTVRGSTHCGWFCKGSFFRIGKGLWLLLPVPLICLLPFRYSSFWFVMSALHICWCSGQVCDGLTLWDFVKNLLLSKWGSALQGSVCQFVQSCCSTLLFSPLFSFSSPLPYGGGLWSFLLWHHWSLCCFPSLSRIFSQFVGNVEREVKKGYCLCY